MKHARLLAISLLVVAMTGPACAPRQLRPVASIDHTPLLAAVMERRSALETGVSGTLEMDFRKDEERFRGKSHVVAFPDGRFRLEIPGPWGSTLLVMTSDGEEILAWYPEEGKAYRSLARGRSINPHLPFPLPVSPDMIPSLFMGSFPQGGEVTGASAALMDSGARHLWARLSNTGLRFEYSFGEGPAMTLHGVTASEGKTTLAVETAGEFPHLPRKFNLTWPGGTIKGQWRHVSLFGGTPEDLAFHIPGNVPVIDLEDIP